MGSFLSPYHHILCRATIGMVIYFKRKSRPRKGTFIFFVRSMQILLFSHMYAKCCLPDKIQPYSQPDKSKSKVCHWLFPFHLLGSSITPNTKASVTTLLSCLGIVAPLPSIGPWWKEIVKGDFPYSGLMMASTLDQSSSRENVTLAKTTP